VFGLVQRVTNALWFQHELGAEALALRLLVHHFGARAAHLRAGATPGGASEFARVRSVRLSGPLRSGNPPLLLSWMKTAP
jgi:hypothetical protein